MQVPLGTLTEAGMAQIDDQPTAASLGGRIAWWLGRRASTILAFILVGFGVLLVLREAYFGEGVAGEAVLWMVGIISFLTGLFYPGGRRLLAALAGGLLAALVVGGAYLRTPEGETAMLAEFGVAIVTILVVAVIVPTYAVAWALRSVATRVTSRPRLT